MSLSSKLIKAGCQGPIQCSAGFKKVVRTGFPKGHYTTAIIHEVKKPLHSTNKPKSRNQFFFFFIKPLKDVSSYYLI